MHFRDTPGAGSPSRSGKLASPRSGLLPMRPTRLATALLLTSLAACRWTPDSGTPSSDAAKSWFGDVEAIADADADAGRRDAIRDRLDELHIEWRNHSFQSKEHSGENILADVTGAAGAPALLIGAHSDQVADGHGATDNASGSAVVLALADRFKRNPLQHHRVAIAFWDLEERGLLGARAFVAEGQQRPSLYVNLDVFGWGDTLWMMTPDPAHPLVAASRKATAESSLQLSAGDRYPPTDHRAFNEAGWPAVSYSLVDASEVLAVLDAYAGKTPDPMPKVMKVIHTADDTLAQLDPNAAVRGVDAIERALRLWDAEHAASAAGAAAAPPVAARP